MTVAVSGESITFNDNSVQATAPKVGMVNRIINGAMVIDQRNAGASVGNPVGAAYTLDRWLAAGFSSSKYTIQQNAGAVTPPVGFANYLGITSSSSYSVPAGEYYVINQYIEGFNTADLAWGTANAATVTLSFLVRSSLTGTFGGALRNSADNRSYPFSYTVSSANTWTPITITVAGDTAGTWVGATNGVGLRIVFSLGSGSTYSGTAGAWAGANYNAPTGAVSVVGTSGATFYITGVQLEKGSTATSFDYRPYGTELALCQRYYYKSPQESNGEMFSVFMSNFAVMGTTCFPVTMRAQPTTTYGWSTPYSGNTFTDVVTGGVITLTLTQNQVTRSRICNLYDNTKTGYTLGTCYSTYLTASAEL